NNSFYTYNFPKIQISKPRNSRKYFSVEMVLKLQGYIFVCDEFVVIEQIEIGRNHKIRLVSGNDTHQPKWHLSKCFSDFGSDEKSSEKSNHNWLSVIKLNFFVLEITV